MAPSVRRVTVVAGPGGSGRVGGGCGTTARAELSTRTFWAGGGLGLGVAGAGYGAIWIAAAIVATVLLVGLGATEIGGLTRVRRFLRARRRA
jgi:hypothetical protein